MIYTVALRDPARLITIEADSYYSDGGVITFTRGGIDEYSSNASRVGSFPTGQIVFITDDSSVTSHHVYPNPTLLAPTIRTDEQRERDREILRHAPAILTQNPSAARVDAFASDVPEGRYDSPSQTRSTSPTGTFNLAYDALGDRFVRTNEDESIPPPGQRVGYAARIIDESIPVQEAVDSYAARVESDIYNRLVDSTAASRPANGVNHWNV